MKMIAAPALLATAVMLAACHAQAAKTQDDVRVDGKTAAEWEAEAAKAEAAADALSKGQPATAQPAAATSTATAAGAAPLQDGDYTCILGYRVMLTLGEMRISGSSYRFHPPQGPDTTGTYAANGPALTWSGDVGIIRNDHIVKSSLDMGTRTDDFWIEFNDADGRDNTVNCKH